MPKKKTKTKTQKVQTSLVPTKVQQDAVNQSRKMIAMANRIEIMRVSDEEKAYNGLRDIKDALKGIESERKKITKPLDDSKKAVQALFKQLKEPFEEADGIIREKILDFRQEQEAKAEEERLKLEEKRRAAEERAAKLRSQGKEAAADRAEDKVVELEEEAEFVVPELSYQTTTVKRWVFEVTDAKKVPRKYLVPDERTIRQAVRDGVRDIPGVDIFQEEGLQVR